jgi:hypothetical protein
MKIVNHGDIYNIYTDSINTYDQLPPQTYYVRFSERSGFFLEKGHEMCVGEDKIYGVHTEKVQKVMRTFGALSRNLGVILSGDKGIGKSLFARCLSVSARESGIPTVIVDTQYDCIAAFLESIEQEVLVLFDEFDKVFNKTEYQTELLGLFDGISNGKKLFVITCNDHSKLSEYLLNRPGRFHYHIRFKYPTRNEIRTYLEDKVQQQYHDQIPGVISFAYKAKLNFDCLRAIAFELNMGVGYKEALLDLNILNTGRDIRYDADLIFDNGIVASSKLSLEDSEDEIIVYLDDRKTGKNYVDVTFSAADIVVHDDSECMYVPADKLRIDFDTRDSYKELVDAAKNANATRLVLKRIEDKPIHFIM